MASGARKLIEQGIARGLHTGAQLYASIHREPAMELALGEARPGEAMGADTLNLWLSMTKPPVAAVVMQQVERGLVELDAPVAWYIPEFAAGGKESVTIEHVLTHTGGFRPAAGFRFPEDDWGAIIAAICDAPLEPGWEPGRRAGYHVDTGWFILGEVVERVTDRRLPEVIRADLFEPLGMDDCWVGMPEAAFERYDARGRLGVMMNTAAADPAPTPLTRRPGLTRCRPGGNGIGPMRHLARFYEMMLHRGELDGQRVLAAETVDLMTSRRRAGMRDRTFAHDVDWGLGLMVNSAHLQPAPLAHPPPYGYGAHASRETFGHGGNQSSSSFADPAHGLVVAVVWNGMPGEKAHQHRLHALLTTLYEDLGLGGDGS